MGEIIKCFAGKNRGNLWQNAEVKKSLEKGLIMPLRLFLQLMFS